MKASLTRALGICSLLIAISSAAVAADPGIPIPFDSEAPRVSDQARGFMLIYNVYTSNPANPGGQNTRFNITNTNEFFGLSVHLYFVEGSTCSVSDRYICLTPNQTMTFLASEQDPAVTGYLLAITTTFEGFPINADYLIGDEFVKFESGFFGNLGAEAIPSQVAFPFFSEDGSLTGVGVFGLPRVLAVDSISSRGDGNETLLVVNALGGFYATQANTIGALFGILYNDQEEPHSWTRTAGCQLVLPLNDSFPRTTPRFDVVIPSGQTGWMKFWSTTTIDNRPVFGTQNDGRTLLGAVFQRNPNTGTSAGAFQEARNLHKLNLQSTVPFFQDGLNEATSNQFRVRSEVGQAVSQLTVFIFPTFPPNCGFGEPSRGGD